MGSGHPTEGSGSVSNDTPPADPGTDEPVVPPLPPGYSVVKAPADALPPLPPGYSADDVKTYEPDSLGAKIIARRMGPQQDTGETAGPGDTLAGVGKQLLDTGLGAGRSLEELAGNVAAAPLEAAKEAIGLPSGLRQASRAAMTGAPPPPEAPPAAAAPLEAVAGHLRGEDQALSELGGRAGAAFGRFVKGSPAEIAAAQGIGEAFGGLGDYATSGTGLMLGGLGKIGALGPLAERFISGYFGAQIAKQAPDLWGEIKAAKQQYDKSGESAPLVKAIVKTGINAELLRRMALGALGKEQEPGGPQVTLEDLSPQDAQAAANQELADQLPTERKPTPAEAKELPPLPPGYSVANVRMREGPGQNAFPAGPEVGKPKTLADLELEEPGAGIQSLTLPERPGEETSIEPEAEKGPAPEREEKEGEEPEEKIPQELTPEEEERLEPKKLGPVPEAKAPQRTAPAAIERQKELEQFIELTPAERKALGIAPPAPEGPFGEGVPGEEAPEPGKDLSATLERREGPPRQYPVGDAGLPGDMALLADRIHNPTRVEARVHPENLQDIEEEHGPEAAQQARKVMGGAIKAVADAAGGDAFETRDGGFSVRAPDEETLRRTLDKMESILRKREWKIALRDGSEARIKVEAAYGLGRTEDEARGALESRQAERGGPEAADAAFGLRPGVPEGLERPEGIDQEGARGSERAHHPGAEREPVGVPGGEPAESLSAPLSKADGHRRKGGGWVWDKDAIERRRDELAGEGATPEQAEAIIRTEKMLALGKAIRRDRERDASKVAAGKKLARDSNLSQLEGHLHGLDTEAPGIRLGTEERVAWHGSPHEFDRFDSRYIGTGEGAQAYGHGLYFAERRGTAEDYKRRLSRKGHWDYSAAPLGNPGDLIQGNSSRFMYDDLQQLLSAEKYVAAHQGSAANRESAIKFRDSISDGISRRIVEYLDRDHDPNTADAAAFRKLADWYYDNRENIDASKIKEPSSAGKLYKVGIPDEVEASMLHWDKPLAEQPPAVQDAARRAFGDITQVAADREGGFSPIRVVDGVGRKWLGIYGTEQAARDAAQRWLDGANGEQIYKMIAQREAAGGFGRDFNERKAAADRLRENGVPGIKYYDQGSRSTGINDDLWHLARPDFNGRPGAGYISSHSTEADLRVAMQRDIDANAGKGWPQETKESDYRITPPKARTHNYVLFHDEHAKILSVEDRLNELRAKQQIGLDFSPEASERQRALEEQDAAGKQAEADKAAQAQAEHDARPKIEGKQVGLFGEEDRGRKLDQMDLFRQNLEARRRSISNRDEAQKSLFDQIESSQADFGLHPEGRKAPRGGGIAFDQPDSRTLYSRVREAFTRGKPIQYTGQDARSARDIATIGLTVRSPHTETNRIFYVKDGRVVLHQAMTSDLPGKAAYAGSNLGDSERFVREVNQRMRDSGADGYYLLHNHPTGDATPSQTDKETTASIAQHIPGFLGHVVINHGQFGFVDARGRSSMNDFPEAKDLRADPEALLKGEQLLSGEAFTPHLAAVGREISNPRSPIVVFADNAGKVVGVQELTPNFFKGDRNAVHDFLHQRSLDFGASQNFAYLNHPDTQARVEFASAASRLVRSGVLSDYIADSGGPIDAQMSGREIDPRLRRGGAFGTFGKSTDDIPVFPVQEAAKEVGPRPPQLEPSDEEEIPKYAGNINLSRKDVSDQVQRTIMSAASRIAEQPEKVSLDELKKKLDGSPYSVEDAKKFAASSLRQRGGWYATRQVADGMADQHNQIREAYLKNPTDENYAKLGRATAALLEATKAEMTAAHEAGLALRTGGMMSEGKIGQIQLRRQINELVEKIKDRGRFTKDVADALVNTDFTDPEAMGKLAVSLSPKAAGWLDKLYEYRVATGLLSPVTPIKKGLGDVVGVGSRLAESVVAPGLDIMRAKLPERFGGGSRERFASAAGADVQGLMAGAADGAKILARDLKTESFQKEGILGESRLRGPAIEGKLGKVVRANTRLISAVNNAAMTTSYRGALYRDAANQAAKEGLSGRRAAARVQELTEKPSLEAQEAAWNDAYYRGYQAKFGPMGERAMAARGPLKWIVPFARVSTNLLKFAGERSPLNVIRLIYKAGRGDYVGKGGELTDGMARTALGTALAAGVASYVAGTGRITGGGPTDPKELANKRATGWQPYSVRFGSRWYPYRHLDPIASVVGPVADFVELSQEAPREKQGELASRLVATITRNIASKSYLQGLEDFFSMMSVKDAPGSAEQFLASFAGSFEPSIVRRATVNADTVERNPQTMAERLEQYVPGMRGNVPTRRDVTGQAIPAAGSDIAQPAQAAVRNLSPVVPSVESPGTPLQRELYRSAAFLPQLPKKLEWRGLDLPLDSHQQDRYQEIVGELIQKRMAGLGGNLERFSQAPDDAKRKAVQRIVSAAHTSARLVMLRELAQNDQLKDLVAQAQQEKARLGGSVNEYLGDEGAQVAARE